MIFDDKTISYSELSFKIESYKNLIDEIPKGSVVAIVSDYSPDAIALFFALYANKNIIVPIAVQVENEVEIRVSVSNCSYIIYLFAEGLKITQRDSSTNLHPLISELNEKEHAGLILFSSGSTGEPKAMIHNLETLIDSYEKKRGKNLVFMLFLMFDHIGGLNTLLICIAMGVNIVFPAERSPGHVCKLIEKHKVNVLPTSPTFLNLILISEAYKKYDLSSLRLITYGTETMPNNLLSKLCIVFNRVKFLQTFGTSETGISQVMSKSSSSIMIKIDDPDTEFKIVGGELWLKSKTQILGYLNYNMDRFTPDGWFKTGDLVESSQDGYIKIVGRNQEVINVGGEKVLPSEVESLLFQMPGVQDCIVFGEFNPITGQMVVAKILFEVEIKTSELKKKVSEFCAGKIEKYKIPIKIIQLNEAQFSARFKKIRIN